MLFQASTVKNECDESGHGNLKLYPKNEQMEETDFLHAGANSAKLEVDSMIFEWAYSKMAMILQFMRP